MSSVCIRMQATPSLLTIGLRIAPLLLKTCGIACCCSTASISKRRESLGQDHSCKNPLSQMGEGQYEGDKEIRLLLRPQSRLTQPVPALDAAALAVARPDRRPPAPSVEPRTKHTLVRADSSRFLSRTL